MDTAKGVTDHSLSAPGTPPIGEGKEGQNESTYGNHFAGGFVVTHNGTELFTVQGFLLN